MIIKNVLLYTEDKYFEEGNIYIKDGMIVEPFEEDDEVIDGEGCYAIPGLVDVHFHGCVGHDFCDGTQEAIEKIAAGDAAHILRGGIKGVDLRTGGNEELGLDKITGDGTHKIIGRKICGNNA